MKYECSKCVKPCTLESSEHPRFCVLGDSTPASNWQPVSEPAPKPLSEAILPKLTVEVFDREDCPEWAKYLGVNRNGTVIGFYAAPDVSNDWWACKTHSPIPYPIEKLGIFDPTDWQNSLIERPAKEISKEDVEKFVKNNLNQGYLLVDGELKPIENKLPDWVKVGAWVWCADCHAERKIEAINGNRITVRFPALDATSYTGDVSEFKPARVRPWTFEEAPAFFQTNNDTFILDSWGYIARHEGVFYTLGKVTQFIQLSGEPCGVLEVAEGAK